MLGYDHVYDFKGGSVMDFNQKMLHTSHLYCIVYSIIDNDEKMMGNNALKKDDKNRLMVELFPIKLL